MQYLRGTNARVLKLALLCVLMAAAGSRVGAPLANCQNEGPYPIRQCADASGLPAWFPPPPGDAGAISATWWILGFGNRFGSDPTNGVSTNPVDGDGFIDSPDPGVFIGVDSGNLTAGPATGDPHGGLDLIDARLGSGYPGAAGGLCFSAAANWALPFVDGCSDLNRNYAFLGGGADVSDDYLNPYFSAATGGPGTFSDYALMDAPMGVLLTESSNKYFAVAFFSATNRGGNPNDIFDKGYDMGAIANGDPNPVVPAGNHNIVPWQRIPDPFVSAAIDPNGDRILSFTWPMIRLVHDNSSRFNPCPITSRTDLTCVHGKDSNGNDLTGVGVLEAPELVSYGIEIKPVTGHDCDPNAPWVEVGQRIVPPIATAAGTPLSTVVTTPPDNCWRLVTHLGRIPSAAFRTDPTLLNRNLNRREAQSGNLGDIGYSVPSRVIKVGHTLLGDAAILRRATLDRRNLLIEFESLGEAGVQRYDVVVRDRSGATSVVAAVECSQCSTGLGANYTIRIPGSALRGIRSVFVVAQPSGAASNELAITRSAERSDVGGRRSQ